MSNTEPKGCLAVILQLFGISLVAPERIASDNTMPELVEHIPFRLRDDFLSAAELSFFGVLVATVGRRAAVCPKVNLNDLFFVLQPRDNQSYRNKIDRKHVDFLICDSITMKPRCGIELDDSSHAKPDRQKRDLFVDQVFEAAKLPLVRIPARRSYALADLADAILPYLEPQTVTPPPVPASTLAPICPKCGIPMIERVGRKGPQVGNVFYGCSNFPRCKEILQNP